MENSDSKKPVAFVIMPFDQDFDEIYEGLFVHTLTKAGFEVRRADDLQNAQNIIADIVFGIAKSNLIVADLTNSNPNVYYELGLAHALNKPVVLLAQRIEELPFDLKSYRVISYTTHFSDLDRAREELESRAAGLMSGETDFGSPISDFLGPSIETISSHPAKEVEEGEPGLLDYLEAIS